MNNSVHVNVVFLNGALPKKQLKLKSVLSNLSSPITIDEVGSIIEGYLFSTVYWKFLTG